MTAPKQAQAPVGVNHIVLNVRNIEVSDKFWTEIIGFKCVADLKAAPGRRGRMKFYSGVGPDGDVSHHHVALMEILDGDKAPEPDSWSLGGRRVGVNHVAIAYPDRETWLKQIEFMQSKGVPFLRRINHGMTHSVYIADPDNHGIEVLYELPREVWEGDIQGAQEHAEILPTEGPDALIDKTENPLFVGR